MIRIMKTTILSFILAIAVVSTGLSQLQETGRGPEKRPPQPPEPPASLKDTPPRVTVKLPGDKAKDIPAGPFKPTWESIKEN